MSGGGLSKKALFAFALTLAGSASCALAEDYADLTRCSGGRCAPPKGSSVDAGGDARSSSLGGRAEADAVPVPPGSPSREPIMFVQMSAADLGADLGGEISFPMPVTKGSTLIVGVNYTANAGVKQLTDSLGNTYDLAEAAGSEMRTQIFYANNEGAGANEIRLELVEPASDFIEIYIHEYTGLAKTNVLDQHTHGKGSATGKDAAKSGFVKTTSPRQLLFSFGVSGVVKAGTGYAPRSTYNSNVTQDRIVESIDDYQATGSPNADWVLLLTTFRAAP